MVFAEFLTYGERSERFLAHFTRKDAHGHHNPFTPRIEPTVAGSSGSRGGTYQP
jgi:hypothetical protein